MRDIFISFSSKDTEKANKTCEFLEANGFKCFISTRDMISGQEYAAQLFDNIDNSKMVLLLLSGGSNESPHVHREIEYAIRKKVPVLVYELEQVELTKSMEYYLMTHQWVKKNNYANEKLIQGISEILKVEKPAEVKKEKKQLPAVLIAVALAALVVLFILFIIRDKNDKQKENESQAESIVAGTTEAVIETTVETTVETTAETTAEETTEELPAKEFTIGESVFFGSYYDEAIEWRVISINDNGTLTLLSKDILSIKSYDAAEGGCYNDYEGVSYWSYSNHIIEDPELQIKVRGNNDWSVSNLRTWLNSDKEVVKYEDQPPTMIAVGNNCYNNEAGFLHNFTKEEREALVPVTNKTKANIFSKDVVDGNVITEDLVYILSSEEMMKLADIDISRFAVPNAKCQENDGYLSEYKYYADELNVKNYYYWLRDNPGEECNKVYIATTELEGEVAFTDSSVGISSYGVRPVICVKADKIN